MEPIKFMFQLDEEAVKARTLLIEELKQNSLIRDFLIENHLNYDFVEQHSGILAEWVQRKQHCIQCSGLENCAQQPKGYLKDIVYDDLLEQRFVRCKYLKERIEKEAYLKNIVVSHGNMELYHHEFSKIDLNQESAEYKQVLKELLYAVQQSAGIYLCGKPGVGKTYLMSCAANQYARSGRKVAFVNSAQLISDLKLKMNETGANDQLLSALKRVDVLFIDDIGGENVTAWSRDEILMPLLNERMEKGRCTYFTSNYNFEELEAHFAVDARGNKDVIKANRLLERIKALSDEKVLKGYNRRVKKTSQKV